MSTIIAEFCRNVTSPEVVDERDDTQRTDVGRVPSKSTSIELMSERVIERTITHQMSSCRNLGSRSPVFGREGEGDTQKSE